MFDGGEAWLAGARSVMAEYAANRRAIDALEAKSARLLAQVIQAYRWPGWAPVPWGPDRFTAQHIGERACAMDLSCEVAVANRSSETAAQCLIGDVADLTGHLPACWARVETGEAPLWQARRIVEACQGLDEAAWPVVDAAVAPCLGKVGYRRLTQAVKAAVMEADPERVLRLAGQVKTDRFVHTGGDEADPLAGWVSTRLDPADGIFLEATVQRIADVLAEHGDNSTLDQRRAKALGALANPAAAVQLIGVSSARGMDPAPETEQEKQAFAATVPLVDAWTPKVRLVVHVWGGTSTFEANLLAYVVGQGPLLKAQVAEFTKGCHVSVTPAVHIGGAGIGVDSYEIPQRIREEGVAAGCVRPVPLVIHRIRPSGPGSHETLAAGDTGPDPPGQSRTPVPAGPPGENFGRLAPRTRPARRPDLAHRRRTSHPRRLHRHPPPTPRPGIARRARAA